MPSLKVRSSARNGRFSTSHRRTGPRDNHQEGRSRYARAFRSLRIVFGCSCLDAQTFNMSIFAPPSPKYLPSAPISVLLIDASSTWAWWIKSKRRRGSQVRFLLLPGVRCDWPASQVHVPQVDGPGVGTFRAPFAARVTNGAVLVMYLKDAPCALGGRGLYGRPC